MPHARDLIWILGLVGACGSGRGAPHDASGAIDAARTDGAVALDAAEAVDAGLDAELAAYIPQPPVAVAPLPAPPDLSHNPVDDQGRPILLDTGDYHLIERAPDPLTALADCTTLIVRCVDPAVQGRTLDACVVSPRRCTTTQPWLEAPCCTDACVTRYEQLRTGGAPPIDAFREAFYGASSCAVGVDALLGGAP